MSFLSGALFRLVYDDCYTNEYAVLRATKSFGQKKYDIFEQNCEHSTRWCKTGIHDSIQMEVCFTTAGKAALIVCLRLISLLILWLLQLSRESQPPSESSRKQERLLNALYMAFIACVFFGYSLYQSCARIKPVVPKKEHDTDICGIESARRSCADATHSYCCCGANCCNPVVLALGCASCFLCSFVDACCSVCRKHIHCGPRTICRRPSSVVIGLFIRIFVREAIAAAGPLLVLYFEDEIVAHVGTAVDKSLVIIAAIVAGSLVAYLIGALVGVWIEALFGSCVRCCCSRPADSYARENRRDNGQPARDEILVINSNVPV